MTERQSERKRIMETITISKELYDALWLIARSHGWIRLEEANNGRT